jgi:hypothetical protein
MINFDTPTQANKAMELAIGRIFHLGSRPAKEGDIKLYEDARYVILCASEYLGIIYKDSSHNYVRDIKFSND